jgi:hypothetical protein
MAISAPPRYDDSCEHLYVKNGKLVAVNVDSGKQHTT